MAKMCGFSSLVAITLLQLRLSPRVILFLDRYSLRCGEFSRDFPCYLASQDHLLAKLVYSNSAKTEASVDCNVACVPSFPCYFPFFPQTPVAHLAEILFQIK